MAFAAAIQDDIELPLMGQNYVSFKFPTWIILEKWFSN